MKVYLCGPINGCTDAECTDWREAAKKEFGEDRCKNPMTRDYRGKEAVAYREIVHLDMRDIRECTVILVNAPKPSWGTAMEVFYAAFCLSKPVVMWTPADAVISPWQRYFTTRITHTLDDAFAAVREIEFG